MHASEAQEKMNLFTGKDHKRKTVQQQDDTKSTDFQMNFFNQSINTVQRKKTLYKKHLIKGQEPLIEKDPMNLHKEGYLLKKSQAKLFHQQW